MEREIGTRFWVNDKLYEIVEQKNESCKKCCFYNDCTIELIKERVGFCSAAFRTDKKNIIVKCVM